VTRCCRTCARLAEYVSAMSAPLCPRHAAAAVARGGLVIPIEATVPLSEYTEWSDEEATG
jgi:hypothetical protein